MGAIGLDTPEVHEALSEFAKDAHAEVAETCALALGRLAWLAKQQSATEENISANPYYSVDPAPPHASKDVAFLKATLLDESLGMFERYRAMFQLRNDGSNEAVLALCAGLQCSSALFRHEIAYVLGQVQRQST